MYISGALINLLDFKLENWALADGFSDTAGDPCTVLAFDFPNGDALDGNFVADHANGLVLLLGAVAEGALLHACFFLVDLIDSFCRRVVNSSGFGCLDD